MKLPFKKVDPLVEAQASVDRLDAQRRPLAERLSSADARVEAAQRMRREALVNGDPDLTAMAALDKACVDAIEARGGVEDAMRAVAQQLEEATRTRDGLRDAAARGQLAEAAERRAQALDDAAEGLARAARAFSDARIAMIATVAQHGVRVVNHAAVGGASPPWMLCQPIAEAGLRLASTGMQTMASRTGVLYGGDGAALDSDPVTVMRREMSGLLRDFAEDVLTGRVPAVEMPRPGEAAAPVPADGPLAREPMVTAVFGTPFSYIARNGYQLIDGEEGSAEVPARVAAKAQAEMAIAFDPGSAEGRAIVARVLAGGPSRARPRIFIDTEADADPAPARPGHTLTATWPDERGQRP